MKLIMGVYDFPYVAPAQPAPKPRKGKARKGRQHKSQNAKYAGLTTGDVATLLEAKYHPMGTFARVHRQFISEAVESSLSGALENMIMGAPVSMAPFDAACSAIAGRFKQFLSDKEMDRMGIPGVPTKAALKGVSHRFRHPYAKRDPRPSFIDTGTYQSAVACEVKP